MASAQKVYAMLGKGALWDAVSKSHEVLAQASIPHVIVDGVAVCLHGYQRNTADVDVLIRREDATDVKEQLTRAGFVWHAENREFRSPDDVPVQFLLSEEPASDDRSQGIMLPNPETEGTLTMIEGLPVLSLRRLIEVKLACGLGNLRRTHRDFADVVELISIHSLSRSFARHLHKNVRKAFRELVLRARGTS